MAKKTPAVVNVRMTGPAGSGKSRLAKAIKIIAAIAGIRVVVSTSNDGKIFIRE